MMPDNDRRGQDKRLFFIQSKIIFPLTLYKVVMVEGVLRTTLVRPLQYGIDVLERSVHKTARYLESGGGGQ